MTIDHCYAFGLSMMFFCQRRPPRNLVWPALDHSLVGLAEVPLYFTPTKLCQNPSSGSGGMVQCV